MYEIMKRDTEAERERIKQLIAQAEKIPNAAGQTALIECLMSALSNVEEALGIINADRT